MGLARHLAIVCAVASIISACTWGTYDAHNNGPSTAVSVPIDPGIGGNARSSDGFLEIMFHSGAVNVPVQATITQTAPPSTYANAYQTAYLLTLTATDGKSPVQIALSLAITFHLAQAGFSMPSAAECFIASASAHTLPGLQESVTSLADVMAIQETPPTNTTISVGPYVIAHQVVVHKSAGFCSPPNDDVCGPCMRACCSLNPNGSTVSPNSSDGLTSACYCAPAAPSTIECMRDCFGKGDKGVCQ